MENRKKLKLTTNAADITHCFEAAVYNITEINTVSCNYDTYNATGLLDYPYMMRAGGNYETPWTRDAAINTWNALRLTDPKAAKTTLGAVCVKDQNGDPIVQPDVQTWDKVVWTLGAWSYYLATGDEDFLTVAYGVIRRMLDDLRENRYTKQGLFRGGSFFNDGIAGYPLKAHVLDLYNSFAPAHPLVEQLMCFSTNCIYCEAYRILSKIAAHFGDTALANEAIAHHEELKETVNRVFWNEALGRYNYILYPDGQMDESQEASGHAFAVLFDICPKEKQAQLLKNLTVSPCGLVSIWPPFEGLYSDEKPGRHNNVVWPFLNGFFMQAATKCGLYELAGEELQKITALFKGTDYNLFEIYSPYTGDQYGGWQLDHVWESCRDQSWSATCYVGAILYGMLGMDITETGIRFTPCVPQILDGAVLENLYIRDMELTVEVKGSGAKLDRILIDDAESEPFLAWDEKAHHITLVME